MAIISKYSKVDNSYFKGSNLNYEISFGDTGNLNWRFRTSTNFRTITVNYQFIGYKIGNPNFVVRMFDFKHNCVYYLLRNKTLYWLNNSYEIIKLNHLIPTIFQPFTSFDRSNKYLKMKFIDKRSKFNKILNIIFNTIPTKTGYKSNLFGYTVPPLHIKQLKDMLCHRENLRLSQSKK